MFHILRQNNADLLREIGRLKEILYNRRETVPNELMPYYTWLVKKCDYLYRNAMQNLQDIEFQLEDTLPEILSTTQIITREFRLFNQRQINPVLRTLPSDHLCLKTLRWLHASNPRTEQIPVALSDEKENSPVSLLNQAWQKFDADSDSYPDWEAQVIEDFLKTDLPPAIAIRQL